MSDEKRVLVVEPNSRVPSTFAKVRVPLVVAAIGIGVAVGALSQLYWIGGAAVVIGVIALIRFAKIRATEHENKMSVPPALDAMKKRLGSLALEPALNPLAERARNQLQRLEAGMKKAGETLQTKLDPGELAYARFRAGLQNGAAAVFAELQDIVEHLNQASLIGANDKGAESSKSEAQRRLDASEKALEAFASAVAAIGTMETNSARVELPQAIQDLEKIAARAKKLSINQGEQNG